nr:immunoglobulin heavy chain junction region [Mus musculus]MBK4188918.1 immunoglobulin heavy chain junction region [Mus musculus]
CARGGFLYRYFDVW